jgi:hypothetical protein
MTDHTFKEMTPDEIRKLMYPPVLTIRNILIWIALALMASGFIVGRWWFYGWLFDHAPRWVSILIAGA